MITTINTTKTPWSKKKRARILEAQSTSSENSYFSCIIAYSSIGAPSSARLISQALALTISSKIYRCYSLMLSQLIWIMA